MFEAYLPYAVPDPFTHHAQIEKAELCHFAGRGENESFLSNRQVELHFMVDREVGGNPGGDATMNVRVL